MNRSGAIMRYYDAKNMYWIFLRSPDGTLTTFDFPGANGTNAASINPAGTITGFYFDANIVQHGFVRSPDGPLTSLDVPGAVGTTPTSINSAGEISGSY